MTTNPPVIAHVEAHLGTIDPRAGYWRFPVGGYWLQVVAFRGRPRRGHTTLCTLGLWHHELAAADGPIRQEFVLVCEDRMSGDGRLACLFPSIAGSTVANRQALPTGGVVGPFGPVMSEVCATEWLLCQEPRAFPPAFAVCAETASPTHFVWLVPISADEAARIAHGGLPDVELEWARQRVDPLDWRRFRRPRYRVFRMFRKDG
jgi:hypothetical protein